MPSGNKVSFFISYSKIVYLIFNYNDVLYIKVINVISYNLKLSNFNYNISP